MQHFRNAIKDSNMYAKKEKLINGPTIPMSFLDMNFLELCSATLNRSHVMLIVASAHPLIPTLLIRKVVIFNSVENLWLEYDLEEDSLNHCRASVPIDKSGKK